jgi:hypothetical protein
MNNNTPGRRLSATETTIRLIVREEVDAGIQRHLKDCLFNKSAVEPRVRTLETRLSTFIGLIIGNGVLGAAAGAIAARLIP